MPHFVQQYEIISTLGHGQWSKVMKCIHHPTRTPYALKILSMKDIARENLQPHLCSEIAILTRLKSPNIVQLHDVLQTTRHLYLVLEWVPGGDLCDRIVKKGKMSEDEAKIIFKQIIHGVSICHGLGIAHRDLKLENILIDENNTVKITDFGLAALGRVDGKEIVLKTVCGTPSYVAPEVIKNMGYCGFKSDVWSCGIVLYVMVTGVLPFNCKDISGLFDKITEGTFSMPTGVSKTLHHLIHGMLQVIPEKRMTLEEIQNHPWVGVKPENRLQPLSTEPISVKQIQDPEDEPQDAFDILSQMLNRSVSQLGKKKEWKQFLASGTPKSLRVLLLKSLKMIPRCKAKSTEHGIKGYLMGGETNTLMTFLIMIKHTVAKETCLIEVAKQNGNDDDFESFYLQLCNINSVRQRIVQE